MNSEEDCIWVEQRAILCGYTLVCKITDLAMNRTRELKWAVISCIFQLNDNDTERNYIIIYV